MPNQADIEREMDELDKTVYEGDDIPQPKPSFWTVAIYLLDRSYGGPEEGGWYYTSGTRIDSVSEHGQQDVPKIFTDHVEACLFARGINGALENSVNKGRCPINSVLSRGMYEAEVCDGYPAERFPAQRPHYE